MCIIIAILIFEKESNNDFNTILLK